MKLPILLTSMVAASHAAILGLDYGQQFTKAVLLAPGISFEIVLTDEGKRKDLSGILIRGGKHANDLERVYGSQTGSLCTRFPQSCVLDLKTLLGKSILDPSTRQYLAQHFGVTLIEDDTRAGSVKFDLGFANQSYAFTVEEVLAMNLNDIKTRALQTLQSTSHAIPLVEDVTISVPPFASPETRQSYLDALHLANFSNVLGLVDEGTAVALNYLTNRKFEASDYNDVAQRHLVFDMGAGSATATLFSFTPYKNGSIVLELENVGYDESFGGKLLTQSIYTIISEKFLAKFNLKHSDLTPKAVARLVEASEKAKLILSANTEYHVSLESIHDDKDFKTTVSRDEFEEINSDLMERITKPILDALNGLSVDELKSIVLNGGSTRVPFVQKHLIALVGEDKIAKSVNADESCALGTTLRGLKLKTKLSKPNDVIVIDKGFHNYEVAVNGEDDPKLVFEKGTLINEVSRVNLGAIANNLDIGLYEDGKLFKTYAFEDLVKKTEKFSCKSKDSKELFGYFTLDQNKMFDLTRVEVECVKEDKSILGKILNKGKSTEEATVNEDEDGEVIDTFGDDSANSTNSTETTTKKTTRAPPKPKTAHVPLPKASYPGVKPFLRTTKEKLVGKLAYLNSRDQQKAELESVRNNLESDCYQLRAYIEHYEDILSAEVEDLSEYESLVGEVIEWLEFESDDASIEDIKEKIAMVGKKHKRLARFVEIHSADISLKHIKNLQVEGSNFVNSLQEKLLTYGGQVQEIRGRYEAEGFDFDKENDRQRAALAAKGMDKLDKFDKTLEAYKNDLTTVGKSVGLSEEEYNSLSKDERYTFYELLTNGFANVLADLVSLEGGHIERLDALNEKFETLSARKKQKELKDKLKKSKKEAKVEEEPEAENGEDDDVVFEEDEPEQTSTETAEDSQQTASEIEHDEL
ncbi:actin-like ATPase domain-containing protein [Suhomyces tanzawaensis NRRL Y-17324]|uniref:Actin-like ATPase domain-containing protein n=1 Tax=Suhomyces tanzawaensis NRRL Y-17324 TaxID=984487 RepID=A0A1E4SHH1_9ASCO|nr:actin-like ATPase domain-containing protein [Suhomyces tanzawaensis NRRL Y-17324]ODV78958.1 actin-like ATPase domain-containing protein [Suhomyces tanzawaensis NRRL Y-17324]